MTSASKLDKWLQRLEVRHHKSIDLGLERVGEVWRALDSPRPARRVFTVAGTNGKGSTVAYIHGMLMALSYRSGTYTSPHVFRYNERVRVMNREASDDEWIWALDRVEEARGEIGLSYFEHGTLAAFLLLERAGLDFAVLEVGLGGRLDAVNLVDPDCAIITPVGLDHQEFLGPDRESIGFEKAGILRPGIPLVCGEVQPPGSVLRRAEELEAPVICLGKDFRVEAQGEKLVWTGTVAGAWHDMVLPKPGLPGPHQYSNLASSLAAVCTLLPDEVLAHPEKIAEGVNTTRVTGRLQAHPNDKRVLVDVGHNPLAAEAVAHMLKSQGQPVDVCVLAMLRDKDAWEVVRILDSQVLRWFCAGLEGERGRSGQSLADDVTSLCGAEKVRAFATTVEALETACSELSTEGRVLVFGSFLTAAQALQARLGSNG
jgi:dihydrofolate synthase/folylpolyglutamate synthase